MRTETLKMPSGLSISRQFSESGEIVSETYSYGSRIGISYRFSAGMRVSEVYVLKGRPVPAHKYAIERQAFPDLPEAGAADDALAAQVRAVKLESELSGTTGRRDQPLRSVDDRCRTMIAGQCLQSEEFVFQGHSSLGERSAAASNSVLRKLRELGAGTFLCRIERKADAILVGSLVVRLPKGENRHGVIQYLDELAREDGTEAECSIGHEFAHVALK